MKTLYFKDARAAGEELPEGVPKETVLVRLRADRR